MKKKQQKQKQKKTNIKLKVGNKVISADHLTPLDLMYFIYKSKGQL